MVMAAVTGMSQLPLCREGLMVYHFAFWTPAMKSLCLKVLYRYAWKNKTLNNSEPEASVISGISKHDATCRAPRLKIKKRTLYEFGANTLTLKFRQYRNRSKPKPAHSFIRDYYGGNSNMTDYHAI